MIKEIIYRGKLKRSEVALQCGFTKSVLTQNKAVKTALSEFENELRKPENALLPLLKQECHTKNKSKQPISSSQIDLALEHKVNKLIKENSRLLAENIVLKTAQDRGRIYDGRYSEHTLIWHEIAQKVLEG